MPKQHKISDVLFSNFHIHVCASRLASIIPIPKFRQNKTREPYVIRLSLLTILICPSQYHQFSIIIGTLTFFLKNNRNTDLKPFFYVRLQHWLSSYFLLKKCNVLLTIKLYKKAANNNNLLLYILASTINYF